MSSRNNTYSSFNNSNLSSQNKQGVNPFGKGSKYFLKKEDFNENLNMQMRQYGSQDVKGLQSPKNSMKKSIAQEYLKQKKPAKYQISSDSDQDSLQQQTEGIPYKQDDHITSNHPSQSFPNKNKQAYQLNLKIWTLTDQRNDLVIEKQKIKDKYQKQIFDLNKQKLLYQQDKNKLHVEIQRLKTANSQLLEQNQHLKEQLQLFIGQNRKTPNFNSMAKDHGELELITMMTQKDNIIKDLKSQIQNFQKDKPQGKGSPNLKSNKIDRSSGQSFGQRNILLTSFGDIEQNLKKTQNSLRQSENLKQNLLRQIDELKKQLFSQNQRISKLTMDNMKLQAENRSKLKQIHNLSQRLNQNDRKLYNLEKQYQTYKKLTKSKEETLLRKQEDIKNLNENCLTQQQKAKKLKRQLQKSQKDWLGKVLKLQNQVQKVIEQNKRLINKQSDLKSKQITQLQDKNSQLMNQNKQIKQSIEQLKKIQDNLKNQLLQKDKQLKNISSKLQQQTKKHYKYKNTCDILQQRLHERENAVAETKAEKKKLKQEAEKIMRKQKAQIDSLKEQKRSLLQSQTTKQRQIQNDQQVQKQAQKIQIIQLNQKISHFQTQKSYLIHTNEDLKDSLSKYEQSLFQFRKDNNQLKVQNDQLKSKIQKINSINYKESKEMTEASSKYQALQSQYNELENRIGQQIRNKQDLIIELTSRCQHMEERLKQYNAQNHQKSNAYHQSNNAKQSLVYQLQKQQIQHSMVQNIKIEKSQLSKEQVQNLILQRDEAGRQVEKYMYKCNQMYEYIQKMHSEGGINNQNSQEINQNCQNHQIHQILIKQNEFLKHEIYRLSNQLQQLNKRQIQNNRSSNKSHQSVNSPQKHKQHPKRNYQRQRSDKSSLQSSEKQNNPLQSALQIMRMQKQQMLQQIQYQTQVINSLQNELHLTLQNFNSLNHNNNGQNNHPLTRNPNYDKFTQIFQQKLQQLKHLILQKQQVIQKMQSKNQKIREQFQVIKKQQNQEINRLKFQIGLIQDQKKELHNELDSVHTELIIMEKEKSKERSNIASQIRTQMERKLLFISEEIQVLKEQKKRLKKEKLQSEKLLKIQIQQRQKLYAQERSKMSKSIQELTQQQLMLRQKLKKANSIINQQKMSSHQINNRNEQIQNEYFMIQNKYQEVIEQLQKVQQRNYKLQKYLETCQSKNDAILNQLKEQVQQLLMQNDKQLIENQKILIQNQRIKSVNQNLTEMNENLTLVNQDLNRVKNQHTQRIKCLESEIFNTQRQGQVKLSKSQIFEPIFGISQQDRNIFKTNKHYIDESQQTYFLLLQKDNNSNNNNSNQQINNHIDSSTQNHIKSNKKLNLYPEEDIQQTKRRIPQYQQKVMYHSTRLDPFRTQQQYAISTRNPEEYPIMQNNRRHKHKHMDNRDKQIGVYRI